MDFLSINYRVSDNYRQLLQYAASIDVDPGVYTALSIGLLIGILILTTLILFPGDPFDFSSDGHDGGDKHLDKHGTSSANKSTKNDNSEMMAGKSSVSGALNFIFYGSFFLGVKMLILDPYGISLKKLFIWQFPREAAVLGLA